MPIIDHSSKTDRFLNNAAPQLQSALGGLVELAFVEQQRADRQREERNRLRLADRDFAFRSQQAERQQQNTDRAFDQRQQIIDREIGQEDAAADYYRSKLQEMYPGPVGGMDFQGMDAQTLRGIYDAELYQRQLAETRRGAQVVWEQVLGEFGIDHQSPEAAQVQAMLDGADTIEGVERAKGMAYEMAAQAREQQFETQRRTMVVEQSKPMRADVKNPRHMAALTVLDQQFLNRDLDFARYWSSIGKVLEEAQGGGDRPTADRIAYSKGLDQIASRLAGGEIDEREAAELRASLGRSFGIEAAPSAAPGGAASPVASAPVIPPKRLQDAAKFVAQKSDPQAREDAALDLATKLLRETGQPVSRESIARAALQIMQAIGDNKP